MATTGKRTVHLKGFKDTIHWDNAQWHPTGETAMQTGDRVFVGNRLDGKLNVKRDDFTLTEIWSRQRP